jgi:hypothetical protein
MSEPMSTGAKTAIVTSISSAGVGSAYVTLAGERVFDLDLGQFDTIGTEGAGSGERYVRLGRVIGVARGQELRLDLSSCTNCADLTVAFEADER